MSRLYTVHKYFNQACSNAGVQTELLVSEDNLRIILSTKPLSKIVEGVRKVAIANNIIAETKSVSSGYMTLITSDPKLNVSSIINSTDRKFGKFYQSLNEAFEENQLEPTAQLIKKELRLILDSGHITSIGQVDQQAQNRWFNSLQARKLFPGKQGYKTFAAAVCALYNEKTNEAKATEQGYDKLAGGWIGTEKKTEWEPDEDEPPRAKDRFFEDHKAMLTRSIDEALGGIAVPDSAAQPKIGVKMLNQALSAKTKSGITLKDALKKQGITWHVAEPGSHIVVFKGKSGDEKWRVEPMTLSDKKVFEATMEALWSVALGKSPNAKELEREAAKQRAKELSDHQKEISGLVDQITGKYITPAEQKAE